MVAIKDKNQYTNITSCLIDFLPFYITPNVNIVVLNFIRLTLKYLLHMTCKGSFKEST